ncbi:hypothetical protein YASMINEVIRUS_352 [Yasminevirus sp. GU-2018]|uniref:Uncharacterized protein n=1 Tax=Yasminevirus sp. GU-2018 TaxID=2420051 RepID=A0A5K0U7E9_9VIRU|nr:hypothetical protein YASMINEVIRUS_352 [Yasminevirus sp. GU-2018]
MSSALDDVREVFAKGDLDYLFPADMLVQYTSDMKPRTNITAQYAEYNYEPYVVPIENADKVYSFNCDVADSERKFVIKFPNVNKVVVLIPYQIETQNQKTDSSVEQGATFNYPFSFRFRWETDYRSIMGGSGTFVAPNRLGLNNRMSSSMRGVFVYDSIKQGSVNIVDIPRFKGKIYAITINNGGFASGAVEFAKRFVPSADSDKILKYWGVKKIVKSVQLTTDIEPTITNISPASIDHCLVNLRQSRAELAGKLNDINDRLLKMKNGQDLLNTNISNMNLEYRDNMNKLLDSEIFSTLTQTDVDDILSKVRKLANDLELERAKKTVFDRVADEYRKGEGSGANIARLESAVTQTSSVIASMESLQPTLIDTGFKSSFKLTDTLVDQSISKTNHDIVYVNTNRDKITKFVKDYSSFDIRDENYEIVEKSEYTINP